MVSPRSTHYWLWFLLFGVVSVFVDWVSKKGFGSESIWLLVTGLLGVLLGARSLQSRLARPFDLIVGLFFTAIGLLGILAHVGVTLIANNGAIVSGAGNEATLFGLSLSLPYALVHVLLGLTSLNLGMRARPTGSTVAVSSSAS